MFWTKTIKVLKFQLRKEKFNKLRSRIRSDWYYKKVRLKDRNSLSLWDLSAKSRSKRWKMLWIILKFNYNLLRQKIKHFSLSFRNLLVIEIGKNRKFRSLLKRSKKRGLNFKLTRKNLIVNWKKLKILLRRRLSNCKLNSILLRNILNA